MRKYWILWVILLIAWMIWDIYVTLIDPREKKIQSDIEAERKAFYLKEAR